MPLYRFRGATRQESGFIGKPLIDETFDVPDQHTALEAARRRALNIQEPAVNAFWLTDPDDELIWSLRGPDRSQAN